MKTVNIMMQLIKMAFGLTDKYRDSSPDFQRSLKNSIFSSADHLVLPLLWFISTPIFVKYLGKEVYGIWMLINGLFGFGGILSLGLTDATIKFTAKYRASEDSEGIVRVLRSTFSLYNIMGLISGGAIAALASQLAALFNVSPENERMAIMAIRLGGIYVWARFVHSILQSALYGFERHDLAARVNMTQNVLIILTNVSLVLLGFGLPAVMISSVLYFLGGAVAFAFILKRNLLPNLSLVPKIEMSAVREVMSFGVYTWVQAIVGAAGGNMDAFILAAFLNPSAVTYYNISKRLAMQAHVLLARGSSFLFPFVSTVFERKDTERLKRIYNRATHTILLLSTGLVSSLFLFGDSILNIWMGAEFAEEATLVLRLLCLRYAVLPMGIVNYNYLRGMGMVGVQTVIALITAPISVAAVWVLVLKFGLIGAAMGQLVSIPFVFFTRAYISRKLFGKYDLQTSVFCFLPILVVFGLVGACTPFVGRIDSLLWLIPALGAGVFAGAGIYWGMQILFQRMRWVTK